MALGLWLHPAVLAQERRHLGCVAAGCLPRMKGKDVMSRCRLQVLYVGTVQGVGFRYAVKTLASGYEVTGTVRNLPDGRVELVVEGMKDELSAFQQAIRESELGHFIRKEEVAWHEPQNDFRGFEIVR